MKVRLVGSSDDVHGVIEQLNEHRIGTLLSEQLGRHLHPVAVVALHPHRERLDPPLRGALADSAAPAVCGVPGAWRVRNRERHRARRIVIPKERRAVPSDFRAPARD